MAPLHFLNGSFCLRWKGANHLKGYGIILAVWSRSGLLVRKSESGLKLCWIKKSGEFQSNFQNGTAPHGKLCRSFQKTRKTKKNTNENTKTKTNTQWPWMVTHARRRDTSCYSTHPTVSQSFLQYEILASSCQLRIWVNLTFSAQNPKVGFIEWIKLNRFSLICNTHHKEKWNLFHKTTQNLLIIII